MPDLPEAARVTAAPLFREEGADLFEPWRREVALALAMALQVSGHGGMGRHPTSRQVGEARRLLDNAAARLRAEEADAPGGGD